MDQHGNFSLAPLAIRDLLGIRHTAESEGWNPDRLLKGLRSICDHIARYPISGTDLSELSPGLRVMSNRPPAHNYVICFRPHKSLPQVEVVGFFHGARDWQAIVKERLENNP